MTKILNKVVFIPLIIGLFSCSSSGSDTTELVGADINIKTAIKQNIQDIGEGYYLNVRNSQKIVKFNEYVETNKDATWTLSKDVNGKDVIPTKTVEVLEGHPNENLYYVYVANDAAKAYETYPVLIHRNYIFTVNFDSDGGSICPSQEVEEGDLLEKSKIPTPTKTGFKFSGWDYDFTKPITSDVNTKALWNVKHYVLTLDPNGGSVTPSTFDVYYGQKVDNELPTPIRNGYNFGGWYYGTHLITNEDRYYFDENITLVASWSPISYSITYNLNGGVNSPNNPTSYTIEDSFTFLDPTRDNYLFSCWKDSKGNKVTGINKGQTGDLVLNAEWNENYELCFSFQLSEDQTYYGVGAFVDLFDGKVKIPSTYNKKPVKAIQAYTFYLKEVKEAIEVPSSITEIQSGAFHCMKGSLEIVLSNNTTKIDSYVFSKTNVTNATIDETNVQKDGVRYIGSSNNQYFALTDLVYSGDSQGVVKGEYVVKDGTVTIAAEAILNQTELTTVRLPSSIKHIGYSAFYNCNISDFYYSGTKSEWANVVKESNWSAGTYATVVHCSNGDASLN